MQSDTHAPKIQNRRNFHPARGMKVAVGYSINAETLFYFTRLFSRHPPCKYLATVTSVATIQPAQNAHQIISTPKTGAKPTVSPKRMKKLSRVTKMNQLISPLPLKTAFTSIKTEKTIRNAPTYTFLETVFSKHRLIFKSSERTIGDFSPDTIIPFIRSLFLPRDFDTLRPFYSYGI